MNYRYYPSLLGKNKMGVKTDTHGVEKCSDLSSESRLFRTRMREFQMSDPAYIETSYSIVAIENDLLTARGEQPYKRS